MCQICFGLVLYHFQPMTSYPVLSDDKHSCFQTSIYSNATMRSGLPAAKTNRNILSKSIRNVITPRQLSDRTQAKLYVGSFINRNTYLTGSYSLRYASVLPFLEGPLDTLTRSKAPTGSVVSFCGLLPLFMSQIPETVCDYFQKEYGDKAGTMPSQAIFIITLAGLLYDVAILPYSEILFSLPYRLVDNCNGQQKAVFQVISITVPRC